MKTTPTVLQALTRELGLFESDATFGIFRQNDDRQLLIFLTSSRCELNSSSSMIYDQFYGDKTTP
ncbi:hypothetical protein PanWU01x14_315490, partial [Parasponia andersonii]